MTQKKLQWKHRAMLAWMLLLTLLPQLVVKGFHHHEATVSVCLAANPTTAAHHSRSAQASTTHRHDAPTLAQGSHHNSIDNCSICDFTMFFSTEPTTAAFSFFRPSHTTEWQSQKSQIVWISPRKHRLRGPPCA